MNNKTKAAFGTWQSPITADFIVSDTVVLDAITACGSDIYWVERRPKESGRSVLVRRTEKGAVEDITAAGFSVSSRVHEYGGGAYVVDNNTVYFCNNVDQRLYKQINGSQPVAITPEPEAPSGLRFADMVVDKTRQRLIAICEDHSTAGQEPSNSIVTVALAGNYEMSTIVSGHDFFSSVRLNNDGSKLAWLSWDHPNMPWDSTELNVANCADDGSLSNHIVIAGGAAESVFQPEWTAGGELIFVSDKSGWWNLYYYKNDNIEPICPMQAEFGLPQWAFGMKTYAIDKNSNSGTSVICAFNNSAIWNLARIDLHSKHFEPIETAYTDISSLAISGNKLIFRAASPRQLPAIVSLDLNSGNVETIKASGAMDIDDDDISIPEMLTFPASDELTAHAFYYHPCNANYDGLITELPPLIVKSHGGPHGSLSSALNLEFQFWTSRGFAVIDVNYGGSTGHGRQYRERLNRAWGIVDVDDCTDAALFLAEKGLVDRQRLLIAGRSASGYTALCALTFRNVFRAGTSYYGISDMVALAADTHKFEAHSIDNLIGPYPEEEEIYIARSPLYDCAKINRPILFLQGLDDMVVPPQQTQAMVDALKAKHIPVACLMFEGERHGFRKAETIKRCLEAELYFYCRILGIQPADKVDPIIIENFAPPR